MFKKQTTLASYVSKYKQLKDLHKLSIHGFCDILNEIKNKN